MKIVRVLSPIKVDGKRQPVGRELPLDADLADELEHLRAVEILGDAEEVPPVQPSAPVPDPVPATPAEPIPAPAPTPADPAPVAPVEPEAKPAAKRAAKKAD